MEQAAANVAEALLLHTVAPVAHNSPQEQPGWERAADSERKEVPEAVAEPPQQAGQCLQRLEANGRPRLAQNWEPDLALFSFAMESRTAGRQGRHRKFVFHTRDS